MIKELAARAKKINVMQLALEVARANSELIADSIRDQLTVGTTGSGSAVGVYSSLWYADMKQKKGSKAPHGIVDLKLSGDLFAGLKVDIEEKTFETDSSVEYSKYQIDRYGNKIYELQKSNQDKIREQNSRDIARKYRELLGL